MATDEPYRRPKHYTEHIHGSFESDRHWVQKGGTDAARPCHKASAAPVGSAGAGGDHRSFGKSLWQKKKKKQYQKRHRRLRQCRGIRDGHELNHGSSVAVACNRHHQKKQEGRGERRRLEDPMLYFFCFCSAAATACTLSPLFAFSLLSRFINHGAAVNSPLSHHLPHPRPLRWFWMHTHTPTYSLAHTLIYSLTLVVEEVDAHGPLFPST